ncbi:MAG: FG-GAP repeat protein [Myxococcaceae bacterium]
MSIPPKVDGGMRTVLGALWFLVLCGAPQVAHAQLAANLEAKLSSVERQPEAFFGASVSARGNRVAIGAPDERVEGIGEAGAVYLFEREASGTAWRLLSRIVASAPEQGHYFGSAVALGEDLLAIGAPGEDGGAGLNSGAIYLYERDAASGDWGQRARLVGSAVAAHQSFGQSLALDLQTLAVGVLHGALDMSGAVYVFVRDGSGSWREEQLLTASDAFEFNAYGVALALEGDALVVGAPSANLVGAPGGSVYLYSRAGGTWSEAARLRASPSTFNDGFGSRVSLRENVLAVVAHGELAPGSVAIFARASPTAAFAPQTVLAPSDLPKNHYFAYGGVFLTPRALVVGTPGSGNSSIFPPPPGYVQVFEADGAPGSWVLRTPVSGDQPGIGFATAMSVHDDTIVACAPNDRGDGGANGGSAFVFRLREVPDAGQGDAGPSADTDAGGDLADAGGVDAGAEGGDVVGAPGCGCRPGDASAAPGAALLAGALLGVVLMRRTRRPR